ncbi:MAG: hypothetical protein HC897_17120 [Thermoanaerobaculia bacterium]|nr:hypothetical protein [Thermoanaerobaculia bacterium]
MNDAGDPAVEAYQNAGELRAAHGRLLERLDGLLEADASLESETAALAELESEIEVFLARAVAAGVFIEDVKDRTACQILLDYWVSSARNAGGTRRTARLERFDGSRLPDLKDKPCPYVGLEAFRENTYFFGRETDALALLTKVLEHPLVVVSGASGTGKSSLVLGGLLPKLAEHAGAVSRRVLEPRVPRDIVLEDLAGSKAAPVVLTIDQFEEVFTLASPSDRQALVEGLAQLLAQQPETRVILTVREEFRTQMAGLRPLEPFLSQESWYAMRPMSYEELRAAVEKPAAMVNLQFQAGIVDDLVKKVLGQPAALPLLQFTLRALWDARDRNRITRDVYATVGDPLSALQTSANKLYDDLTHENQAEAKRILLELVRVDELLEAYRQPVPKAKLLEAGRANTAAVLERLAEHDFVRLAGGPSGGETIVEVKHEALIRNWPLLVGWIEEKRIQRRQRLALTQAAEAWAANGKPEDEGLLGGWQLEEAKRQEGLSALERASVPCT